MANGYDLKFLDFPDEIIATVASYLDLQSSTNFAKVIKNRHLSILKITPQGVEFDNLAKLCEFLIEINSQFDDQFREKLKTLKTFQSKTLLSVGKFNTSLLDQLLNILVNFPIDELKNLKSKASEKFENREFFNSVFELAILYRINLAVTNQNIVIFPLDIPAEIHDRSLYDFLEINNYCVNQIILNWIEIGKINRSLEMVESLGVNHAILQNAALKLAQLGYSKDALKVIEMIPGNMRKFAFSKISPYLSDHQIESISSDQQKKSNLKSVLKKIFKTFQKK